MNSPDEDIDETETFRILSACFLTPLPSESIYGGDKQFFRIGPD
jgi:hypothetical protein